MKIYSSNNWSFRKNKARKNHPALVVGEKNNLYANLGITHSKKRGHHSNIELSNNPNPKDFKKSYLRNDIQYNKYEDLKEKLSSYKLSKSDIDKVYKIINKKR